MFLNRESIELINALKARFPGRVAQTNSRFNGSYLKHIRVYESAEAKKVYGNHITLWKKSDIEAALREEAPHA